MELREGPKPVAVIVKLPAHSCQSIVPAEDPAQQQSIELPSDWTHEVLKRFPLDFSCLVLSPVLEQQVFLPHQVITQSFDLSVGAFPQLLDVSLQMSPAPLKTFAIEIHLRSITIQDDVRVVTDQRLE